MAGSPDRMVGLILRAIGADNTEGAIGRSGTRLMVETQVPIIVGDVTIQGTGLATESKQDTQVTALHLIRDRLLHGGKSAAQWLSDIAAAVAGTLAVSVTNFPASVEVANDLGGPLAVSGTVAVANPTADPETGLAKEVTLQQVSDRLGTSVDGTIAQVLGYIMGRIGSVTGKTLASLLDAIDAKVATETTLAAVKDATGTTADANTLSTQIGILKRIRDSLWDGTTSLLVVVMARLPAALGANGGLKADQVGQWTEATDPASTKAGRTKVTKSFSSLTVDGTAYTVTAGKRLRITQLTMSIHNVSTTGASLAQLRDGSGGTVQFSLGNPTGVVGAVTPIAIANPSYSTEPLDFLTSVYFDVSGGSPVVCLNFVGYEENL